MSVVQEFRDFLKKYNVLALAVAFIMGLEVNDLVKSLVNDVIMPVLTFFLPHGSWRTATFAFGSVVISWGSFLSALINFVIIAFVVFLFVKAINKVGKKTAVEKKKK